MHQQMVTYDNPKSFASRMLANMGWTPGTGLGKNRDGMSSALEPSKNVDRLGLGAVVKSKSQTNQLWWMDHFEQAITSMVTQTSGGRAAITNSYSDLDSDSDSNPKSNSHSGNGNDNDVVQDLNNLDLTEQERRIALHDRQVWKACGGRRCRPAGKAKLLRMEKLMLQELDAHRKSNDITPLQVDQTNPTINDDVLDLVPQKHNALLVPEEKQKDKKKKSKEKTKSQKNTKTDRRKNGKKKKLSSKIKKKTKKSSKKDAKI